MFIYEWIYIREICSSNFRWNTDTLTSAAVLLSSYKENQDSSYWKKQRLLLFSSSMFITSQ